MRVARAGSHALGFRGKRTRRPADPPTADPPTADRGPADCGLRTADLRTCGRPAPELALRFRRDEDRRQLVDRQGFGVDAAHAARTAPGVHRGSADDHQRGFRSGRHARRPPRAGHGASRGCRSAALRHRPALAVLERSLRIANGRCRAPSRSRRLHPHRLWRSLPRGRPPVSRGAPRRHRPDAALSVVEDEIDLGSGGRDDRRRSSRLPDLRSIHGSCLRNSPAVSSIAPCSPTCPKASTRAARTASSTRSCGTVRCSPTRWQSRSASA